MNRRQVLRLLSAGGIAVAGQIAAAGRIAAARGAGASAVAAARIKPDATCALLIIDVQNCFVAGGTLAVPDGDAVIPVINRIAPAFANVILTQDWHTPGHASFASAHPGSKPYDTIAMGYGNQVLWPDHCVQGTHDAELDAALHVPQAALILRKGFHRDVDSYSAFEEADRKTTTGLAGYLRERGVGRLFVTGLATDFCVASTALDARRAGFTVDVIDDACRGIDIDGSVAAAWRTMTAQGIRRIRSTDLDLG